MAKAPKTTQPAFTVTSGELHKDHWTSAATALRISPTGEARVIRLTLWNPYYNRAYLNNQVEVLLDGRKVFTDRMQPARSAVIDYDLAAGEALEVEVRSEAVMVADPLDPRERGIILKLSQEAAAA